MFSYWSLVILKGDNQLFLRLCEMSTLFVCATQQNVSIAILWSCNRMNTWGFRFHTTWTTCPVKSNHWNDGQEAESGLFKASWVMALLISPAFLRQTSSPVVVGIFQTWTRPPVGDTHSLYTPIARTAILVFRQEAKNSFSSCYSTQTEASMGEAFQCSRLPIGGVW